MSDQQYTTTIATFYRDYNKPTDLPTLVLCLVDYITHYLYASRPADYADQYFDVARFLLCDTQSVEAKPFSLYFDYLIFELKLANSDPDDPEQTAFCKLIDQAAQEDVFNQPDQTHQPHQTHQTHQPHQPYQPHTTHQPHQPHKPHKPNNARHGLHASGTDSDQIDFYPRATVDDQSIKLSFLVNNRVASSPSQQDAQSWLDTFYQDQLGKYVARQDDLDDPVFTSLPASMVQTVPVLEKQLYNKVQIGWKATVEIKIGFVCLAHQLSVQPDMFDKLASSWQDHTVGSSTPKPSSQAFVMSCPVNAQHPTGNCDCAYFATYQSVDCPASQLYFCQYNQECLCVVSRVMPWSLRLNQRINSKFAQCFDLACPDQNPPIDCSDEQLCQTAKQWLSNPNWFETMINPGGLDVQAVEQACKFKVAQVPSSVNQFFVRYYQVIGLACPVVGFCLAWIVNRHVDWRSMVVLVLLVAVLAVLTYASSGVQLCKSYGLANQASCYDRLSQKVELSRADCADQVIMCQCNSAEQGQQLCTNLGLNNCRCQNDQTCQPATGESVGFLAVQPAAQRVRLQVVLACCGAFFLCSPVCWSVLRRHCAPVWLVVLCVVVLAVLVVGLPVGLTTRQTMKVVQTSVQQAAC